MSIALGIVGGVAQGTVQAREVSRTLHRQSTDPTGDAKRVRDRLNAHLDALDEGDETNQISELRIDDQVPQRQPDQHERDENARQATPQETDEVVSEKAPAKEDEPAGDPLYRHLDVTG